MKVIELINAKPALETLTDKPLNVSESLKLARLVKSINTELQTIDEQRMKLCEKYGTKSDNGQQFVINEDKKADFAKAMDELMGAEISLAIEPITIKSDIKITAKEIMAVENLINFEEV